MRFLALVATWALIGCVVHPAYAQSIKPDSTASGKSHVKRNLLIGNVVVGTGAYFYFADTWGAPNGKLHLKNEFHDNVAMTDEISHFYTGYKLTDGFRWAFGLFRMPEQVRLKYAALQSALILTLIEYPLDAYNPGQGFGISDLVFDYGGIGFALLKDKYPTRFDMKFSVKRAPWEFEHKLFASENDEFANFVWWATYTRAALSAGLGYSIRHDDQGDVHSQYFLGVGTTVFDIVHLLSPEIADEVKALDSYFINFKFEL